MPGVTASYDENGNVTYYATVAMGTDAEGGTTYQYVPVPASAVQSETVNYYGDDGPSSYQQFVIPSSLYEEVVAKAIEAVTPPPMPKDYTRPKEVQESEFFSQVPGIRGENVNSFSGGALGRIYDAINSGAYKVSPDKSQLITPYGNFGLQSLGNNLYDIPIGAKSGSYRVAIGINNKGQAIFDKNFLDNGAIRYVGGAPGGALRGFVNDIGPVGNIALAVATGGLSIPEQIAAQTAYNMVGGANLEDALTRGALTVGVSQGIQGLTGGAPTGGAGSIEAADAVYGGASAADLPSTATTFPVADQTALTSTALPSITAPYDPGSLDYGPGAYDVSDYASGAPTGGIADLAGIGADMGEGIAADYVAPAAGVSSTGVPLDVQNFGPGADLGEGIAADYTSGLYDLSQPVGYDYASGAPSTPYDTIYGQGEGAFPGAEPGTVASDIAGTSGGIDTLYGQGEGAFPGTTEGTVASDQGLFATMPDTTIYGQGEGAFPGPTEGTVASDQGLFVPPDSGMIYGQGEGAFPGAAAGTVASDVAGTGIDTGIIGGVGGIGLADILKYAGLAGLASTLLGGGKTAGGGGGVGPDQTPVGAGLSPDYKPYRYQPYAMGGITALAGGGYNLGGYSDGGRLLRGPGDGVSDDIPASIGGRQPARLANNEFVIPARIVSEIGNGSTDAGARALYAMMDRVQKRRQKTMGKGKFAVDTKANKELEKL
jgi:hypothetical protein